MSGSQDTDQTSVTATGAAEIEDTETRSAPAAPDPTDRVTETIEQEQQGYPDEPTTS